jgi:hypothetical protein
MKPVVTFSVVFSLLVQAQPPAKQQPVDSETSIRVDVSRVQLLFTVSDKKGRFVSNLNKSDFEILESKKSQSITEFTAETDLPASATGSASSRKPRAISSIP